MLQGNESGTLIADFLVLKDQPKGKETSQPPIWDYFTKSGEKEATCSVCDKTIKMGAGITKLKYHLKRKHPEYVSEEVVNMYFFYVICSLYLVFDLLVNCFVLQYFYFVPCYPEVISTVYHIFLRNSRALEFFCLISMLLKYFRLDKFELFLYCPFNFWLASQSLYQKVSVRILSKSRNYKGSSPHLAESIGKVPPVILAQ